MYKFKIGDRVVCNGRDISGYDIYDEHGIISDISYWDREPNWPKGYGYIVYFDDWEFESWNVPESSLRYENEEEIKKMKLEKEKKFLKYRDIDPFGEEIWEQYNWLDQIDSKYEEYSPKFKIGDRVICSGIEDGLNIDDCVGTISWVCSYNESFIYTVNFEKSFSTQLDEENSWNVDEKKLRIYDAKEEEIRMKKRRDASLRNIDKDPFQEEIWEGIKKFKDFI